MKCAIFCWLLALCAFQMVHAVTQKNLDDACKTYVDQFHSYATAKQAQFKEADNKIKKAGADTDDCEEDFNVQLREKVPNVEKDINGCKNIKAPNISAQSAARCCKSTYDDFKKWIDNLVKDKIASLPKGPSKLN